MVRLSLKVLVCRERKEGGSDNSLISHSDPAFRRRVGSVVQRSSCHVHTKELGTTLTSVMISAFLDRLGTCLDLLSQYLMRRHYVVWQKAFSISLSIYDRAYENEDYN